MDLQYKNVKDPYDVISKSVSHSSHVRLFVIPWTRVHQSPLSMELSRQEYWSGLPCPSPGDLPALGVETASHISCIGRQVLHQ